MNFTKIPPPWRHYDNNSLFRLECDVWNVAESVGIFFEVPSYHIYVQNICYEHRTLYTAEGAISMQELWGLLVIYLFCCTRIWSLSSKVSIWKDHDLHAVSLYGRDDPVHHGKVHKEKMSCTWGWLPKESWR